MNLEGTVALVTGSARRVGRAIALELARAGCDVALHYRDSQEDAVSAAEAIGRLGRRCELVRGDLTDPQSPKAIVGAVVRSLGRLNILVNNAAIFEPMRIGEFDLGRWERTMRVNLAAPAALCHHARPYLLDGAAGKIINLCDVAAERPWRDHLAYCVSKAGLVCLTRALAKAFAPTVQVNGIAPGIAAFPESYDEATRAKLVARVPLRREGSPSDVARAVRFLVEDGDYITGQIITVDGGRSVA